MTKNQSTSIRWQELDVLRGLAVVLMIINHLEVATLAPSQLSSGLAGILFVIGSFAPVVFFFVTGVGYGLQSSKQKANHWYVILNKVAVLFLADQLMHWSEGRWLGLDFLGFIGFSSLVLELIRVSSSPVAYCFTGLVSVSLMRYLLLPGLRTLGYQPTWGWLGWIIGYNDVPGVEYTLSPWLAYPFVGYLVGVATMRYQVAIQKRRWQVISSLLLIGVVPAIAGIILTQHGSSLFRWGSVAIGFYITSFAALLVGLALSLAISSDRRLKFSSNALLMKGISSFAVVPVHYFLIYLLVILGVSGLVGSFNFYLLLAATLTSSFLLAHLLENCSQMIRQIQQQRLVWLSLVVTFLLMAGFTLFLHPGTFFVMLTRTIGQIVLCLLFVIRPPVLGTKAKLKTS